MLESILVWFISVRYSSNGFGLYLYRRGVMFGQQESEQRCGGSQVLPCLASGDQVLVRFFSFFVPKCDATCVVGMKLLYVYIKHSPGCEFKD